VYACSVARLCPTLWNRMRCSPLHLSVHGNSHARTPETVAISSPWDLPGGQTHIFWLAGEFFSTEPQGKPTISSSISHFFSMCSGFFNWIIVCQKQDPGTSCICFYWMITASRPLEQPKLYVSCVCVCVCVLVVQSCPTFCDLMDCSPPGSSVHRILQAKNIGVGIHFLL